MHIGFIVYSTVYAKIFEVKCFQGFQVQSEVYIVSDPQANSTNNYILIKSCLCPLDNI